MRSRGLPGEPGAGWSPWESRERALGRFLADDDEVRGYLASFNVRGMDDVDALGIRGPYRRDFERIYLGKAGWD